MACITWAVRAFDNHKSSIRLYPVNPCIHLSEPAERAYQIYPGAKGLEPAPTLEKSMVNSSFSFQLDPPSSKLFSK